MELNQSLAFVLRRNAYRDNSLLLDLYTQEEGRIAAVARYSKKQGTRIKGMLEPFRLLEANWRGRGEVFTLAQTEEKRRYPLKQQALMQATYMNELLLRAFQPRQAAPELFQFYWRSLHHLQAGADRLMVLRFELLVLDTLGLPLSLWDTDNQGAALVPSERYRFHPERGVSALDDDAPDAQDTILSGELLLALQEPERLNEQQQQALRGVLDRLWRVVLAGKTLHARALLGGAA